MYRSGKKEEMKVVLVFSKGVWLYRFGIHHPVEKSERQTKGSYPVYLTRPSLDSVCYNHLYTGCSSKYNQLRSERGWYGEVFLQEKNK